jgi:hypothetical protein
VAYELEHFSGIGPVHEVKLQLADGRRCHVVARPEGQLVWQTCPVPVTALPEAMARAVQQRLPGARLKEVEHQRGPGRDRWKVKVDKAPDGRQHSLLFDASARLLAHLLVIPAQVEVPLVTPSPAAARQ